MVSEHSVEENPIPQQNGQVAQEEQQSSDTINTYVLLALRWFCQVLLAAIQGTISK